MQLNYHSKAAAITTAIIDNTSHLISWEFAIQGNNSELSLVSGVCQCLLLFTWNVLSAPKSIGEITEWTDILEDLGHVQMSRADFLLPLELNPWRIGHAGRDCFQGTDGTTAPAPFAVLIVTSYSNELLKLHHERLKYRNIKLHFFDVDYKLLFLLNVLERCSFTIKPRAMTIWYRMWWNRHFYYRTA